MKNRLSALFPVMAVDKPDLTDGAVRKIEKCKQKRQHAWEQLHQMMPE